ncbi:hypothetical protein [Paenibacillus polymyxa]|uniref:Uncharacterized protein n=1 Tax=Paenibacillus polymyxa TaxID=1406 RepID=A0AAP3ZV36_PAEPO|nr:hypothetical protein [Paenibacillus polymyxa]MDH2329768.1 hypothetical protein [Paenibacillus polymyxa]
MFKFITNEGEKPIEEIEVGEKVLAKSDETGEVAYKEVVGLSKNKLTKSTMSISEMKSSR